MTKKSLIALGVSVVMMTPAMVAQAQPKTMLAALGEPASLVSKASLVDSMLFEVIASNSKTQKGAIALGNHKPLLLQSSYG